MGLKELKVDLSPHLKKMDVYSRKDVLSKTNEGEWSTVFKGHGIEFAGFRVYQYGDDASLIDWKASLRANDVMVREFEEFKNFTVFFLLDVSDSMLYSSTGKLKCEYAAELVYSLSEAITLSGDSVGLAMFNDNFINSIYPDIGAEILQNIKKNLLNPNNYGGGFDLKKALLMARSILGREAVIVIVSDFIGLEEGWDKYIEMLGGDFELLAFVVRDKVDRELPLDGGQFMAKHPFTGGNIYVDAGQYHKKYKEMVIRQERHIETVFRKSRGDFLLLTTDKDYLDGIMRFFNKRSKRQD